MLGIVVTGERRGAPRYECQIPLRLEHRERDGSLRVGDGHTEDLSQLGLRFHAEEPLEIGTEVVTRIDWPILLQNVCRLELIVRGAVTHVTDRGTILVIRSYEFRTCGPRSFWEASPPPSNWRLA